ncbi:MAG: hypothetical protein EPO28_13090 [Saprospiraceae bacterium]|nr:MAG: hypothetical protein EPO28_13090 [Saprospiraceae bacterium]
MNKPAHLPLLLTCFFLSSLAAQTDLSIGQWKQHLPFKRGISVSQSDSRVYYATPYALLTIDKAGHALEQVTKVEGLSQVGVSQLKYNRGSNVLVVVYTNSVIDLIDESGVRTLFILPQSNIILGEKRVNDIYMANDSVAYLAANFGIATLNLRSGLSPNTIKTPFEVKSVQIYQGIIYAATEEGLYFADPNAGYNIDDFSNWSLLAGEQGFPAVFSAKNLAVFNGKLYVGVNDSLYMYDGSAAQYVHHYDDFSLHFLSAEGAHLLAGYRCPSDCNGKVFIFDGQNQPAEAGSLCVNHPQYAIEDESGSIWYADDFNNYRVETPGTGTCELIGVNSPRTISISEIAVGNGNVWVATGGLNNVFTPQFRADGILSLIGGDWDEYNLWNRAELAADPVSDFYSIAVNPQNGKIYSGAFLDALVVYDPATDEIEVFKENNSTLQLAEGDPTRSRVAGIAFDAEGNLWICNNNAPEPLSVLKADGSWQSFSLPCTAETGLLNIAVDAFGYKWLTTTNSSLGLIVFDEGDFDNPADDRCKVINMTNSVLPSNEVRTVELDLDGAVWVGTRTGALVFQCNPLDGECPGTRPFVEVDGFGANLLEDQDVPTIGVDGANRKWFGTGTGVFVMSPDGNQQIAKFTAENSPLFDNNIVDIAFNHQTGEVFIGTLKGLVSYRSDATEGTSFHQSDVTVFPNPVRPDYEGPIAIQGLARDATVKITDISGQLVFETKALGGQAIWDGRDYNSRKANSGVYLVFATSRNSGNPDVAIAKILLLH